jgi:hypothetical protein
MVEQQSLEAAWEKARETPPRDNPLHMKPGIYFDIDFEAYCRIPAINKSSLTAAKTSLAHYYFRPPPEDAPHFRMGSLVHAGKLEPEEVAKRYVVIPESLVEETQRQATSNPELQKGRKPAEHFQPYASPRATGLYKRLLAEFLGQHPGKQEVSQEWFDNMKGMVASMDQCPEARPLFESGWPEVTIIWRDPETSLLCKARADWLCENADQVDVKTAADITRWSLEDWDYHIQAASYLEGYYHAWDQMTPAAKKKFPKSLDPYEGKGKSRVFRPRQFHFCVIEKTCPWTCLCAPTDERPLCVGHKEYHFLLRQIRDARTMAKQRQDQGYADAAHLAYPTMRPPRVWTFGRWFKEDDYPLYRDYGDPQPEQSEQG